jgi:HTH-type transcriptional regulator/antitoxin HigA
MVQLADMLSDFIGPAKRHPLLDLFELASELIRTYEHEHFSAPDAKPQALLAYLMKQHQLKQSELPEVGNQSVISQILSGTRQLNVIQINSLAKRFKVPAGVFLERA